MDAPLKIDTVGHEDSLLLVVVGELDIATSPSLDEALARARATDAASIVVDLSAVSFIDSTGLHVLLRHTCAEEGGPRVSLTTPSPQARRVFELSGLLDYLPFVSD
jgi:anti-sigma B factor antagonist